MSFSQINRLEYNTKRKKESAVSHTRAIDIRLRNLFVSPAMNVGCLYEYVSMKGNWSSFVTKAGLNNIIHDKHPKKIRILI